MSLLPRITFLVVMPYACENEPYTVNELYTCNVDSAETSIFFFQSFRCSGLGYSCQSSHPAPSCIKTSECVGDGTCRPLMKSNRTICRPAVDPCDKPER